jgi:hypothetical protein
MNLSTQRRFMYLSRMKFLDCSITEWLKVMDLRRRSNVPDGDSSTWLCLVQRMYRRTLKEIQNEVGDDFFRRISLRDRWIGMIVMLGRWHK